MSSAEAPTLFVDAKGRRFEAVVNLAVVTVARSRLGLDLGKFEEGGWLDRAMADYAVLGELLWLIYQQSATSHGLTPETFPEILAGDVFEGAQNAMVQAVINFCPGPQRRAALQKMLAASHSAVNLMLAEASAQIEAEFTPERILASLKRAGATPESSESTPAS